MVHSRVRVCVYMCHFVNFVNFSDSKTISYLNLDNSCVVSSWENKNRMAVALTGGKQAALQSFMGRRSSWKLGRVAVELCKLKDKYSPVTKKQSESRNLFTLSKILRRLVNTPGCQFMFESVSDKATNPRC